MRKVLALIILIAIVWFAVHLTRSAPPVIDLPSSVAVLGQYTAIAVHVRDPYGIRRVTALVEQGGVRYSVWEAPPTTTAKEETWNFTAGVKTTPQLRDGKAKLIVEAVSGGLMRKSATEERELTVVSRPPTLTPDSDPPYLYLGMADLATFNVSGTWTEAGVARGGQKIPGGA